MISLKVFALGFYCSPSCSGARSQCEHFERVTIIPGFLRKGSYKVKSTILWNPVSFTETFSISIRLINALGPQALAPACGPNAPGLLWVVHYVMFFNASIITIIHPDFRSPVGRGPDVLLIFHSCIKNKFMVS